MIINYTNQYIPLYREREGGNHGFRVLHSSDVDIVVEVGSHPSSLRRGRKHELCLGVKKVSRKILGR